MAYRNPKAQWELHELSEEFTDLEDVFRRVMSLFNKRKACSGMCFERLMLCFLVPVATVTETTIT
jgi:hypothetical protein